MKEYNLQSFLIDTKTLPANVSIVLRRTICLWDTLKQWYSLNTRRIEINKITNENNKQQQRTGPEVKKHGDPVEGELPVWVARRQTDAIKHRCRERHEEGDDAERSTGLDPS